MKTKILPFFDPKNAHDLLASANVEAGSSDTVKNRMTADVAPAHQSAAARQISTDAAPIPIGDMRFRSVRGSDIEHRARAESGR